MYIIDSYLLDFIVNSKEIQYRLTIVQTSSFWVIAAHLEQFSLSLSSYIAIYR